jgi:hypothetical protein
MHADPRRARMRAAVYAGPHDSERAARTDPRPARQEHQSGDAVLRHARFGKNRASDWILPLCAHTGLHGLGTLLIVLPVKPALWWLALVDFAIHTVIDRGKGLIGRRTHFPPTDTRFWWLIGLDQFLHQVTHIGLAAILAVG